MVACQTPNILSFTARGFDDTNVMVDMEETKEVRNMNNIVLLVTSKQYEYGHQMVLEYGHYNTEHLWDERREYFAKRGYESFWFKGIPVIKKKLKKYIYIDLRKLGNDITKWIKKIHEEEGLNYNKRIIYKEKAAKMREIIFILVFCSVLCGCSPVERMGFMDDTLVIIYQTENKEFICNEYKYKQFLELFNNNNIKPEKVYFITGFMKREEKK